MLIQKEQGREKLGKGSWWNADLGGPGGAAFCQGTKPVPSSRGRCGPALPQRRKQATSPRPGMQTETLSHPSQTPSKPVVYPSAQATHCLGVFPGLLASSTPQVSSWCSEDSRSLQNRLLSPCAEHCSGFHPQWVTCSLPCVSAHGPCSTQVPQLRSQAISFPSPSPGAQTPHLLEWQDLASLSVRLCSLGTD